MPSEAAVLALAAISGLGLVAKISSCWRTLATLQRHYRIRSYLTTARSHRNHPSSHPRRPHQQLLDTGPPSVIT